VLIGTWRYCVASERRTTAHTIMPHALAKIRAAKAIGD